MWAENVQGLGNSEQRLACKAGPLPVNWQHKAHWGDAQKKPQGPSYVSGKEGMSRDLPRMELTKLGDSGDVGDERKWAVCGLWCFAWDWIQESGGLWAGTKRWCITDPPALRVGPQVGPDPHPPGDALWAAARATCPGAPVSASGLLLWSPEACRPHFLTWMLSSRRPLCSVDSYSRLNLPHEAGLCPLQGRLFSPFSNLSKSHQISMTFLRSYLLCYVKKSWSFWFSHALTVA